MIDRFATPAFSRVSEGVKDGMFYFGGRRIIKQLYTFHVSSFSAINTRGVGRTCEEAIGDFYSLIKHYFQAIRAHVICRLFYTSFKKSVPCEATSFQY